jgi:aryl-alcohol dehydrogenase-like predicted oxidoreductase
MQYRYLGATGVQVSEYAFGTMTFGKETQEPEAKRLVSKCLDAGINCFDCADLYCGGRAEEILGRTLQGVRDEVILISKAYFPIRQGVNNAGLSRRYLIQAVEASLERLGTDYLDVFYMHRFDERTSLDETLRALDDLVTAGKLRYLGASNFAAWQVAKALGIQEKNGWAKLCTIQPMYNLVKRQAEVELLPLAMSENLAVLSYSPLAAGLLTGKYGGQEKPGGGRLVDNSIYRARYGEDWMAEAAGRFVAYAAKSGIDPVPLAIAWVAAHPAVTSVILGARDVAQLDASLAVREVKLTGEMREEMSALSRTPSPATDRNEEMGGNSYALR